MTIANLFKKKPNFAHFNFRLYRIPKVEQPLLGTTSLLNIEYCKVVAAQSDRAVRIHINTHKDLRGPYEDVTDDPVYQKLYDVNCLGKSYGYRPFSVFEPKYIGSTVTNPKVEQ